MDEKKSPYTEKELANARAIAEMMRTHKPVVTDMGDGWIETSLPPHPMFANSKNFQKEVGPGFLICMVELRTKDDDPATFPNGRFHMSISHNIPTAAIMGQNLPGRYPTWDEIREARYKFVPHDVNMAIMFPPPEVYYNRHSTCIHLVQVPVSFALDPNKRGGI